jgi:diadenosine tetraphosphate (Ap4A) HIT family hydrolase
VNCIFCQEDIAKTSHDGLTFTLRDRFPVSPGHTLVIMRRHVASFGDTTVEEQQALLHAVAKARRAPTTIR